MPFSRLAILLLICLPCALIAQAVSPGEADQKFIHYIEPAGLVIIERMEQGTTMYGLSRKYNVHIDSILAANPYLDPAAAPLGHAVHIPVNTAAVSFTPPQAADDSIPIFYRVQPKETLYRISKIYLGTSPESVLSLNPRVRDGLSIGQVLHLGWYIPHMNSQSPASAPSGAEGTTGLYTVTDFTKEYKTEGKVIREEKGLAVWKPGNIQSQYYVLHPTAKVGSYMEVTNPMLHRTLTAKVAGNIPQGIYPSQVGLVVSPSIARALGILDQQFFARWRFVE